MSGMWTPVPADTPPTQTGNIDSFAGPRARGSTGELDRDAFLNLLITQMRHQDPLNPMDDRDFVAQMAQFSALEQAQHQTRAVEMNTAHGMIGKNVFAHFFCDAREEWVQADGMVQSVTRRGSTIMLGVEAAVREPVMVRAGDGMRDDFGNFIYEQDFDIYTNEPKYRIVHRMMDVPFDRISYVSNDYFMDRQLQGILDGVANSRDIGLIGRWVQAITIDDAGNPSGFVEGQVEFVRFVGGQAVLMVNGQEVFANEIFSVSDSRMVIGEIITIGVRDNDSPTGITFVDGYIEGIQVRNGNAYVVLHSGHTTRLDYIDHLVEALQMIGRHVTHPEADFNGRVSRVSVGFGAVNIFLEGETSRSMGLVDFRRTGGTVTNILPPTTPPSTPPTDPTDPPADNNPDDESDDD
jgi:flagellar basal-body rod modification protein FlgD